jgi:hypothetical protein
MAKITIARLLETAKFLATKSGQELADFITYVSDLSEQVLRTLNSNVTIRDNLSAKMATISLKNDTEQVINTDGKIPVWVAPMRVVSNVYGVDDFHWWVNQEGEVVVRIGFTGAPSAGVAYDVSLVIFFA